MIKELIKNRENLSKALEKLEPINSSTLIDKENLNFKIKELEIQKRKANINNQILIIDTQIEFESNKLSEEEYNQKIDNINSDYEKEIKLIDDNISILNSQKNNQRYSFLDIKQKNNKQKNAASLKRINLRENQARLSQLKNIATGLGSSAIVVILSTLVNRQMSELTKEVANLNIAVDNTNQLIDNITDEKSIEIATISRNLTLVKILSVESKLDRIKKAIDTISTIVNILTIIVTTMQIIATVSPLPPVRTAAQLIVNKLQPILISLNIILNIFKLTLNNLLKEIIEIKKTLKDINPLTNPNLLLENNNSLYGRLGLIEELNYKGFRFVIKEENNPNFVVKGIKRRYAVALNNDDNEVLKSDFSFTLDPNVLVEELKLIIDQTNLKP